jgi:hypothetical protein
MIMNLQSSSVTADQLMAPESVTPWLAPQDCNVAYGAAETSPRPAPHQTGPTSSPSSECDQGDARPVVALPDQGGGLILEYESLPLTIALVGNRSDASPEMQETTWGAVVELLQTLTCRDDGLSAAGFVSAPREVQCAEKDGPGWMPVSLVKGGRRRREDIERVHLLVLDFDNATPLATIEAQLAEWEHVGHTTYSHNPAAPRCRVVLPLRHPILPGQQTKLFDWINAVFEGAVDGACGHDPARFYYLPCCPHDATDQFQHWHHAGRLLDYDELADAFPEAGAVIALNARDAAAGAPMRSTNGKVIDFGHGYVDGERTAALIKRAGHCLARGLSLDSTIAEVLRWNEFNDPPLPRDTVIRHCEGVSLSERRRREEGDDDYAKQMRAMNEKYVWVCKASLPFRLEHNDFATAADIRNTYCNREVQVPGGPTHGLRPLGDAWLRSPHRRQVRAVVYEPGKPRSNNDSLNLWTGWGCDSESERILILAFSA